jgi:hypothetical protein
LIKRTRIGLLLYKRIIYGIPERKKLLSKDPEIHYPGMEIAGTATFAMQGKEIQSF